MKILQVVGNSYVLGSGIYSIINPLVQKLNERNIETNVLSVVKEEKKDKLPFVFMYNENFYNTDFDKYDLVIFHGIYYYEFINIAKLLMNKKIPYLIKPHSSLTKASYKKHGIRKLAYLFVFYTFFHNAKGIIFTNEEEKKHSFLFLNKQQFLEMNGIDLDPVVPVEKMSGSDRLNLIYLSRIDLSHKGVDILLNAIERLLSFLIEKNCFINFYGVGQDRDMKYFNKRIKKISSERVVFHGPLFGQEKNEVYNKSDIMLLTSRYEGFPTVLIEATMHSIPCVITEGTNGKFLADNNAGWYVPNLNAKTIAFNIKKAITDYMTNRNLYRINARKLAENTFDIEKTIENTIRIYQFVISQ